MKPEELHKHRTRIERETPGWSWGPCDTGYYDENARLPPDYLTLAATGVGIGSNDWVSASIDSAGGDDHLQNVLRLALDRYAERTGRRDGSGPLTAPDGPRVEVCGACHLSPCMCNEWNAASARRSCRPADGHATDTPTTKDTNPKDAAALARLAWSVLPVRALAGAALAMREGAWKYGRSNFRVAGVSASVYFDATLRHLFAWWEGEDLDPASGLHHIDKAIAGLLVVRDAMLRGMCNDDRPPSSAAGWIEDGAAKTGELLERMKATFGDPKPAFTREPGAAVVNAKGEVVGRLTGWRPLGRLE